jgi:hypothetical protein
MGHGSLFVSCLFKGISTGDQELSVKQTDLLFNPLSKNQWPGLISYLTSRGKR